MPQPYHAYKPETWDGGKPGTAWPNFDLWEFQCRCPECRARDYQEALLVTDMLDGLQAMRDVVGTMSIVSGYRCEKHPDEVVKDGGPGAHAHGLAVDVSCTLARKRYQIITVAQDHGFVGIGVARSFIHLDFGHPWALRPAAWTY